MENESEIAHALAPHQYRAYLDALLDAPTLPFVVSTRARVFSGFEAELDERGLLPPARVAEWLRTRQAEQERVTWLQQAQRFTSGTPAHVRPGVTKAKSEPLRLKVEVRTRERLEVQHVSTTTVDVDMAGPLGWVKAAADALGGRFGWTEPTAAAWLLCGSPPSVPGVSVSAIADDRWTRADGSHYWRRLAFEIPPDFPLSALPGWTALQAKQDESRRGRPIGQRQLQATVFAVTRNDGAATWAELLERWNVIAPPAWQYHGSEARRDFAKDVRSTFARLTGEPFVWKRTAGEGRSDGE